MAFGITLSSLFPAPACAEEVTGEGITTNSIQAWPQAADITSTAAFVMEDSTNTILFAKNMNQTLYPGSSVKIMTTLLALENSNLTDLVTMTGTGLEGATDGGANIAAQIDEVFTMEQCLYAIMLASANDVALQVAEQIGGSVENFVQMMNTRAQELGCTNTLFTNPTGLPDENQHVTAHDMALIMEAAIRNESFRTIASTASYTIPPTNLAGGSRVLTNSFSMTVNGGPSYYSGCLGGKEGFTQASGSTLVCAAEKNGEILIAVVLQGAQGQTAVEAASLLDYGFNSFQLMDIGSSDFDVLSGGIVIAPVGATKDNLSTQDQPLEDGTLLRTYYYGGAAVGTAIAIPSEEQDTTLIDISNQNMQEAEKLSAKKTYIPYYLIGGVGAILVILMVLWIAKIAKS